VVVDSHIQAVANNFAVVELHMQVEVHTQTLADLQELDSNNLLHKHYLQQTD
jgi:hypothetical protein